MMFSTIAAGDARPATKYAPMLRALGLKVITYGLALVMFWIGFLKFQPYEAAGIMPLIAHSPFMSWMLGAIGLRTAADIIGSYEIIAAGLIVVGSVRAQLGVIGGSMAVLTFLGTLSFIFTTPAAAVYQAGFSFPFFSMVGQFLIKDIVLLGAAIFIAADAWIRTTLPQSAR